MKQVKDADWIEIHSNHCMSFSINNDYVEENIHKVSELLSNKYQSDKDSLKIDEYLINSISSKIRNKILDKEVIGLLCSGGEDSVYLLLILIKNLNIKPKLFCYETKNNASDVKRLKKIANQYDLELNIFNAKTLNREHAFDLFVESKRRLPNDIAQPVHNALYLKATENFNCDLVIDGQMCDTVLLSNPQNHFLLWFEKYNFFIKNFIKFLSLFPLGNNKIGYRINLLNQLCNSSSLTEIILNLVNIKNPNIYVKSFTNELVTKFGIQLVFAGYFYTFLLEQRERDKYHLCPKIYSPFDDFNYAFLANSNIDQILGLLIRKKPIRRMCKEYFPKLFRFQNTLPFELE